MADRRIPVRVREDLLPPATIEPRRERPRSPPAARAQAIIGIRTTLASQCLALEIQQVCGAVPLTKDEDQRFATLREMRERYDRVHPDRDIRRVLKTAQVELAAAYSSLVKRLPCTHCGARSLCPAAHARRVN